MLISAWSSDVCSSDLCRPSRRPNGRPRRHLRQPGRATEHVPPRTQDDPLMAVIVLPSDPAPNGATPMLRDFGGTLTPFLGGPEQRINRLGTRLGIRVSMPPMRNGDNGRIFVSRLLQAKQDRLLMDWPQPGFTIGAPGSPLVSTAASGGTALAIK